MTPLGQRRRDIKRFGRNVARRSPHWPAFKRRLLKQDPTCAACGGNAEVELHHIIAFHQDKSRELDPKNIIRLCEDRKPGGATNHCHLQIGHKPPGAKRANWKTNNPEVIKSARAQFELKRK